MVDYTASLQPSRGGLAALLGFKPNPVTDYIGNNRSALLGLAAGLAGGPTWGEGLSNGFQMAAQGGQMDRQAAEKLKAEALANKQTNATKEWLAQTYPDLAQAVDAGLPISQAWQEAFNRKNAKVAGNEYQDRFAAGQQFGLSGDALNTFALTGSVPGTNRTNVTYGTTPVWGTDESGKTGYGVTGSDGSFKLVDTGGFQPMGPFDVNAQKAGGTAFGKGTTEAALNLPNTIAQAEQSLANLSGLLPQLDANGNPVPGTNKGFDEQFGTVGFVPQQWLGTLDGTEKAGYQGRIRQVQGEAFLTAIAQLKGLGALSDAEGQTATKAITRISEKLPQGEFIKAVQELQAIVARGVERARAKAAQAPGPGAAPGGDPDVEGILSGLGI